MIMKEKGGWMYKKNMKKGMGSVVALQFELKGFALK